MTRVMSPRAREGEASDRDRVSRLDALLLALGVASLAVLPWLVNIWPAEEEPRRLAIAHALLGADRPGSPYAGLPETAAAHPVLALLAAAGRIVGVATAGRLVCSVAIAALCLAQWLLLRRLAPQRQANIHLLLPLSTGPLLLRGGTPLMLGLALGLTAVALIAPPLMRERGRAFALHWPVAAVAAVLLATAGVMAPLALLLSAAALLLLTGRGLLARRAWPLAVLLALAALPGIARAVEEMLAAPHGAPWVHARLDDRVLGVLGANLATFSGWEAALRRLPVLFLLAGAALAIRRGGLRGSGTARLVAGALVIALLMPSIAGLPPCSEMAGDMLLWTTCALAASLPSVPRHVIAAVGLCLAASLTMVQSRAMGPAVAAIEQVRAVGRSIPRGSRVLPLRFGAGPAIDPLRHAWAHVAIDRDIVTPFLAGGGALLSCASPLPAPAAVARLPHLGEDAAGQIERIDPHRCAGVTEPAIDCGCAAWKATRYAALLEAAAAYDRMLVIAPPDDLLAAGREVLVPLARAGDVHLFAVRAAPHPGLLCEP